MVPIGPRFQRRYGTKDFSRASHKAPDVITHLSRAYNQRPKTIWTAWRGRIFGLAGLALVVFFIYSPVFRIQNVIINNVPSAEAITQLHEIINSEVLQKNRFLILPQSNILLFSKKKAAQSLASIIDTRNLVITKTLPNVVRFNFPTTTVVALWQVGDTSYLLDQRGSLIQELAGTARRPEGLVIVRDTALTRTIAEQVASNQLVDLLKTLNNAWIESSPSTPLDYVLVAESALPSVQVYTKQGWYVYLSLQGDPSIQLTALKRLLQDKIKGDVYKLEYMDVRFGSRLYYKLR